MGLRGKGPFPKTAFVFVLFFCHNENSRRSVVKFGNSARY